jgi:large subunit ribosomal protein L19
MEELIKLVQSQYRRDDMPAFRAGDTVNVHVRIKEGDKERIQQFQGIVIQRRGTGATEMVTVRKISNGVGVERIFPIHSPILEKIELIKQGRVRRARIFYMRERFGKSARIRERVTK